MREHRKMTLKRIGIGILCMVFVLSMLAPLVAFAEEKTESGSQVSKRELAYIQISVGDGQETPVFKAGQKVSEFRINVKNNGNVDAHNVRIEPDIKNASDWPFELDKLNYEKELSTIKSGGQTAAVWGSEEKPLIVRGDVTGKSYKLEFKISYDDGEKSYETDKYVFVKTTAKEKPSENQGGNANGGEINNGNTGNGSGGSGNAQGTPDDSGAVFGGVYTSDPVMAGGSAGGADASSASVPRVIVTGFNTEPAEVRAGSNFKLIVHLKNTSSKTAVSNMLFDMQAPSSGSEGAAEAPAFLPASGSSSVYLDGIPAGGTSDISIELNARADLVKKPYSISMSMKYEDSSAAQYEAQSSLAIPVIQDARFEFSKIEIAPETVAVGEEANISCSLYNLGRVKMYNVKARFEGKMIESDEQFIGNLDSGATGMIDAIVTAKEETMDNTECKLILTYEDDAGNVSTAEEKFDLTVMPMSDAGDLDAMAYIPEEQGGLPIGMILAAAVVVIVAVAVAIVLIMKRKKAKRLEAEEEELFDEVERSAEDER